LRSARPVLRWCRRVVCAAGACSATPNRLDGGSLHPAPVVPECSQRVEAAGPEPASAGALGVGIEVEVLDDELSDESEVELDDGAEPLGWRLRAPSASAGAAARSRVRPSAKCRVSMASS
jgi:hypothetical protein